MEPTLTIHLVRAKDASEFYRFDPHPQDYNALDARGVLGHARLPWDELRADLEELVFPNASPDVRKRLGERLREFFMELYKRREGWEHHERALLENEQRRKTILFRIGAVELFAVPWELTRLGDTRCLGGLQNCVVRYECVGKRHGAGEGGVSGRLLFAWSDAEAPVRAEEHRAALQKEWPSFRPEHDEIAMVDLDKLHRTLQAAEQEGKPVRVLHLLCHGTELVGGSFGLALHGPAFRGGVQPVDGSALNAVLSSFKDSLQLVVLSACHGANPGPLGRMFGGVAHDVHRLGIPAVIASRMPLSLSGAIAMVGPFYRALRAPGASIDEAFHAARNAVGFSSLDWVSLQLFARSQPLNAGTELPEPMPRRVVFTGTGELPPVVQSGLVVLDEVNLQIPSPPVLDALSGTAGRSPSFAVLRPLQRVGAELPAKPSEWRATFNDVDQLAEVLTERITESGANPTVHVFARAPLPLMFHLGWRFARHPLRVYQQHREWGDTWSVGYDSELAPGRGERFFNPPSWPDPAALRASGGRLGLTVEVTHSVNERLLTEWLGAKDGSLPVVRLVAARTPSPKVVEGPSDAARGLAELRECMDRIARELPDVREVWLALVCPLSFAAALGRAYQPTAQRPLVLFNYRTAEGYVEVHRPGARKRGRGGRAPPKAGT